MKRLRIPDLLHFKCLKAILGSFLKHFQTHPTIMTKSKSKRSAKDWAVTSVCDLLVLKFLNKNENFRKVSKKFQKFKNLVPEVKKSNYLPELCIKLDHKVAVILIEFYLISTFSRSLFEPLCPWVFSMILKLLFYNINL